MVLVAITLFRHAGTRLLVLKFNGVEKRGFQKS